MPRPTAWPLTAAMTGLRTSQGWNARGSERKLSGLGAPNTPAPPEKSAPAQKARPAPVMTTARTSSSASLRRRASVSSVPISVLKALSFSGRFRVMTATRSSTE